AETPPLCATTALRMQVVAVARSSLVRRRPGVPSGRCPGRTVLLLPVEADAARRRTAPAQDQSGVLSRCCPPRAIAPDSWLQLQLALGQRRRQPAPGGPAHLARQARR